MGKKTTRRKWRRTVLAQIYHFADEHHGIDRSAEVRQACFIHAALLPSKASKRKAKKPPAYFLQFVFFLAVADQSIGGRPKLLPPHCTYVHEGLCTLVEVVTSLPPTPPSGRGGKRETNYPVGTCGCDDCVGCMEERGLARHGKEVGEAVVLLEKKKV